RSARLAQNSSPQKTGYNQRMEDRRRHWRFPVDYRVVYETGGHSSVTFMCDLSPAGMTLSNAKTLEPGAVLGFAIHLGDPAALTIQGKVVHAVERNGARVVGVEFVEQRADVRRRLAQFWEATILPKVKGIVKEDWPKGAALIQMQEKLASALSEAPRSD